MVDQESGEGKVQRGERHGVVDRWHSRKPLPTDFAEGDFDKCCVSLNRMPASRHKKGMRWQARFVDSGGRDVGKGFNRQKDAQAWLDQKFASVVRKDYVHTDRSSVSVEFVANRWLDSLSALKPSTRAGYENRWSTHVKPRWGSVRLSDVEYMDIVGWLGTLKNANGTEMSASSKQACWGVLNKIMDMALNDRRITANPAAGVKLPKVKSAEHGMVVLTHEQVINLGKIVAGPKGENVESETAVLVLGTVGLRFGELAGLKVGDIDYVNRSMRIRDNVVEVNGRLVSGTPKSHEARTVNFSPVLLARRLHQLCDGRKSTDYVFQQGGRDATGESKPLRRTNWTKRVFYPAAIEFGYVDNDGKSTLSPHDMRHAAAAFQVRLGGSVHVVMRQLGHSRASVTLDVYSFLFNEDMTRMTDAMDAVFLKLLADEDDGGGNVISMAR